MSIPIDIIIAISVWSGLWILYRGIKWWLFWDRGTEWLGERTPQRLPKVMIVGVFLCPNHSFIPTEYTEYGVGNLNFILYIYLFIPKLIITIVKTFLLRDEIYEYESNFSSHFVNYIWYNLVEELMTDQNITVILVLFTIIYWTWMIRYIKKK